MKPCILELHAVGAFATTLRAHIRVFVSYEIFGPVLVQRTYLETQQRIGPRSYLICRGARNV